MRENFDVFEEDIDLDLDEVVEEINEEGESCNRSRAWRRKKNHTKAKRKHMIAKRLGTMTADNEEGRYIKGKVHCSCPLCSCKTKDKRRRGKTIWYSRSDQRKIDSMDFGTKEFVNVEDGDDSDV